MDVGGAEVAGDDELIGDAGAADGAAEVGTAGGRAAA